MASDNTARCCTKSLTSGETCGLYSYSACPQPARGTGLRQIRPTYRSTRAEKLGISRASVKAAAAAAAIQTMEQ